VTSSSARGLPTYPLRHAHWREILKEHDDMIKAEAEKTAHAMLRIFIDERAQTGSWRLPTLLLMDMDNETFGAAVVEHLESGNGQQ
jgi:hypothetical protein